MKSLARRVHRLQRQFAPAPDYWQNPRDRFRLQPRRHAESSGDEHNHLGRSSDR
jgi:hypothetical protein